MANDPIIVIKADNKASVELKKLNELLGRTAKSSEKLAKKSLTVSKAMKAMLGVGAINKLFRVTTQAIGRFNDEMLTYEDRMKAVKGITDSTDETIQSLHRTIMDGLPPIEIMSSEIANATLQLSKMGVTAEQQATGLEHILNLATASVVGTGEAAETTMNVMRAFGKEVTELEHIVDVLHGTITGSSMGFEDMAETMKHAAPFARTAGVTFEETAAMAAVLANVGIKGSLAGTALKNMFLNLMKPGEKIGEMLARFNGKGKNFIDILVMMKDKQVPVTEMLDLFNKRAIGAVLNLQDLDKQVREYTVALTENEGVAKKAAETMRGSLLKQFQILKKQLLDIGNEFIMSTDMGEHFNGMTKGLSQSLIDLRHWIAENSEEIGTFLVNVVAVNKAIGKAIIETAKWLKENSAIYELLYKTQVDAQQQAIQGMNAVTDATVAGYKKRADAVQAYINMLKGEGQTYSFTDVDDFGKKREFTRNKTPEMIAGEFGLPTEFLTNFGTDVQYLEGILNQFNQQYLKAVMTPKPEVKAVEENTKATDKNAKKTQDLIEFYRKLGQAAGKSDKEKLKDLTYADLFPFKVDFSTEDLNVPIQLIDIKNLKDFDLELDNIVGRMKALKDQADIQGFQDIGSPEVIAPTFEDMVTRFRDSLSQVMPYVNEFANLGMQAVGMISQGWETHHESRMKQIEAEMSALEKDHKQKMGLYKDNFRKRSELEDKFSEKQKELEAKKEAEQKKFARKRQRLAIFEATTSAILAAVNTLADTRGGPITRALAASATLGLGMARVSQIRAQELKYGGEVDKAFMGSGNAYTDNVPVMASPGEYMINAADVRKMGGAGAVRTKIDEAVNNNNMTGGTVNVYIDTNIGTEEFTRQSYKSVYKQATKWNNRGF